MRGARTGIVALACVMVTACGQQPAAPEESESTPLPEPSPAAPESPTPSAEPRQASVAMNGDLLWHNTLWFGAEEDGGGQYDFGPLLEGVKPVIEDADLAVCHNEVPVGNPDGPFASYPTFVAPPQTLDAVKATGYDACTTASNHSLDDGFDGIERTLQAMDDRGIQHVGTARSEEEASTPMIFTTEGGVRVGIVEGTYGTNGIPLPEDAPWSVADIDPDRLLERARATREAGADIVMVAVHGGEEYQTEPNPQQQDVVERLTQSDDVDLVYGHHVHVVQPITKVNDKWVVYGLGNLVAQHETSVPRGYEGMTVRFTFTETGSETGDFEVSKAEYFPTLVTHYSAGSPARTYLVNDAIERGEGDVERLKEAKARTSEAVNLLGGNEGLEER